MSDFLTLSPNLALISLESITSMNSCWIDISLLACVELSLSMWSALSLLPRTALAGASASARPIALD
jgi:hypothetical protein